MSINQQRAEAVVGASVPAFDPGIAAAVAAVVAEVVIVVADGLSEFDSGTEVGGSGTDPVGRARHYSVFLVQHLVVFAESTPGPYWRRWLLVAVVVAVVAAAAVADADADAAAAVVVAPGPGPVPALAPAAAAAAAAFAASSEVVEACRPDS